MYGHRMCVTSADFWMTSNATSAAIACLGSGYSTVWLRVTSISAMRFTTPAPAFSPPSDGERSAGVWTSCAARVHAGGCVRELYREACFRPSM